MNMISDPMLNRIVQAASHRFCLHRGGDLLCSPCFALLQGLEARIAGSGSTGLSEFELRQVYVRIAVDEALSVLHLTGRMRAHVKVAIDAARAWADNPTERNASEASAAAGYATHAIGATAPHAMSSAVNAARAVNCSYQSAAVYAAAATYRATYGGGHITHPRLTLGQANRHIDLFVELTGWSPVAPDEAPSAKAVSHAHRCLVPATAERD